MIIWRKVGHILEGGVLQLAIQSLAGIPLFGGGYLHGGVYEGLMDG